MPVRFPEITGIYLFPFFYFEFRFLNLIKSVSGLFWYTSWLCNYGKMWSGRQLLARQVSSQVHSTVRIVFSLSFELHSALWKERFKPTGTRIKSSKSKIYVDSGEPKQFIFFYLDLNFRRVLYPDPTFNSSGCGSETDPKYLLPLYHWLYSYFHCFLIHSFWR
jgi:hypothetical protein